MTIPKREHDENAQRRQRAEEIARRRASPSPRDLEALSLEETRRMLHELQVHQIELELQNEELREARAALEERVAARAMDLRQINEQPGAESLDHELRKKAEETLRRQQAMLARTESIAHVGSWEWEVATDNVTWSDELFRIFQRDPAAGAPSFAEHPKHYDPEDMRRLRVAVDAAVAHGTAYELELRIIRKDGETRVCLARGHAEMGPGNSASRLFGSFQDITERKRTEEALRKSEERYSRTLNALNDGLWDWHIPSGEAFFSALYYTMLGYEDGAFPATYDAWRVLVHPEDIGRVERELQQSVETGSGFSIDLRMRKKNGRWLWVSTRGKVIERDEAGKALRIVGILSDITERQRAQAEREKLELQNRQLQKAESLGRMAGAIAHHFNNQLQAVTLNLELARREVAGKEGLADRLTEAMQSARKAAEVSGLMLTYLGVTVGQSEPMDLADACRRCLPLLRACAPRSVALETDMPSPGPVIRANANQIQQVLTNLVTNAGEASGDGRSAIHLAIRTAAAVDIPAASRFPIDWQPCDPAYACLEVADSGCGIPERDIEKIFDPFFSTKFTGRGMGLAVVLGIVRSYQGGLTVESQPGRGSVFRVFFPITTEAIPRPPDQPPQGPAFHASGTVLLVEDEPFVRQVVAKALARVGFTVLAAKDGVEALEIFRQHQGEIRLVLTDLTMPRMDGWETLTTLRQLAPDLPVILSSGYNKSRVMAGHHSEQPQAFLSKPYAYEELIGAINQVLAKGNR